MLIVNHVPPPPVHYRLYSHWDKTQASMVGSQQQSTLPMAYSIVYKLIKSFYVGLRGSALYDCDPFPSDVCLHVTCCM
jgi:hypothetical protein